MPNQKISVPYMPWFDERDLELSFPDNWDVRVCHMRGKDQPPLDDGGFRNAFENPINSEKISTLAKGRKEVCIVFDDMTRPTKVHEIAHYVLEELKRGDVKDSSIRFIVSLGAHGAHSLIDFRKKLGDDILRRFPVFNHNPYECCRNLGKTSRGTPVEINAEFLMCDLKIAIGSIAPHVSYGFGGGGKIIMPGLASMDAIWHNHNKVGGRGAPDKDHPLGKLNPTVGLGKYEGNVMRLDMEEATRMAGLDIKVDAIVNYRRDTVALFVGDPIAEHAEGVRFARDHYMTEKAENMDIAIVNAFSKANEGHIATFLGSRMLKKEGEGGDLVCIISAPGGQIPHYLLRSGGKFVGGRIWGRKDHFPPGVKRFYLVCEHPDWAGWEWFGPRDQITWVPNWSEVLTLLRKTHGAGTKVAVLPDATIQYFG